MWQPIYNLAHNWSTLHHPHATFTKKSRSQINISSNTLFFFPWNNSIDPWYPWYPWYPEHFRSQVAKRLSAGAGAWSSCRRPVWPSRPQWLRWAEQSGAGPLGCWTRWKMPGWILNFAFFSLFFLIKLTREIDGRWVGQGWASQKKWLRMSMIEYGYGYEWKMQVFGWGSTDFRYECGMNIHNCKLLWTWKPAYQGFDSFG